MNDPQKYITIYALPMSSDVDTTGVVLIRFSTSLSLVDHVACVELNNLCLNKYNAVYSNFISHPKGPCVLYFNESIKK